MTAEPSGLTPAQTKMLNTIRAEFALRGHEVHELLDGGYLISRWGLFKHCPTLAHLEAAARQILGATA